MNVGAFGMDTSLKATVAAAACSFLIGAAHAGTIDWNAWTSATSGMISADSVAVTFSAGGSTDNLVPNYPSYTPASTWADGTIVSNAPTSTDGIIQLTGGNTNINAVSFSTPVVDPVMAIWSLGAGGREASFDFTDATPTFVTGGPSAEYGGSAISVSGNDVTGIEGNGTIQFIGTFSQISWTNPSYENWYGFDVGIAGVSPSVPEPGSLAL
jgi:hypothetical protein